MMTLPEVIVDEAKGKSIIASEKFLQIIISSDYFSKYPEELFNKTLH